MKGSACAPLVFFALAAAVYASRDGAPMRWLGIIIPALVLAALGSRARRDSLLLLPVAAFCALTLAGTLFSPSYNASGIYHPAVLAAGFIAVWRLDESQRRQALLAAFVSAVAIAAWGIWQVVAGHETRASAYFETANTFAGLLAMLALPALLSVAIRPAVDLRLLVLAILAGAILASQSRGAAAGLVAGAFVGAGLLWLTGVRISWRGIALAFAAIAAGCMLFLAAAGALRPPAPGVQAPTTLVPLERRESIGSRLELYRASVDAWRGSPALGTGYLSFAYVFEAARPAIPSYDGAATSFVHNDYLQTLQELGVVGLAALLAMLAAPFVVFVRQRERWSADRALAASICLAAIAAMAAHAVVDFPFYVPATLLVLGGMLGAFARLSADGEGAPPPAGPKRFRHFLARAAAVTAMVCLLVPPAIAQACDWLAQRAARQNNLGQMLYWYKVASNFQPADWRYWFVLGGLWTDQALITQNRQFATFADEAFRAGVAANPRDPNNLLGLLQLHRRAHELLEKPASAQQMGEWSRQLLRQAPKLTAARRERVMVLLHLDRWQEAREEAERWQREEPQNPVAAQTVKRLSRPAWPQSER